MWPILDAALHPPGRSVHLDMSTAVSHQPHAPNNIHTHIRDLYRLHFSHELAAGTLKPLVVPYSLLGTVVLPILYFSIPHTNRPWLYRARYPLWALILVFNLHEAVTSSSANFAVGYAVGLMQAWGILWTATLLIWMSPQFEAERVERRKRTTTGSEQPVAGGTASGVSVNGDAAKGMKNVRRLQANTPTAATRQQGPQGRAREAPDETVARSLAEGYEYYWQSYPAAAPFLARLGWSYDLVTSFRGTGWNWTVPIIPHFSRPDKPLSSSPVDIHSIPLCTRQGYRRFTTRRAFARAQLLPLVLGYLALDAIIVLMVKDPHFILGPDFAAEAAEKATASPPTGPLPRPLTLPPFLAALPPPVLFTYRAMLCFSAIFTAIELIMTLWQLACLYLLPLGTRAELWHYPSTHGAFAPTVLDRGLAGFWGGWWHQTFRVAFGAPAARLAARGWLPDPQRSRRGRAAAGLLAFAQSAFLHSLGSVSCLPASRAWAPPVFFMLAWAGVLVQEAACAAWARPAGGVFVLPRAARRAANLAFVFAWLCGTQYWFCDDLARAGIWLLEPVPASPLRALGLGMPGDSWLRWDPFLWPRWHVGRHWWESGLAL